MQVRVQITAFFFFSLLLLQCDFNINLMPYSVSPTFFTPYDAQASSSCSALINSLGCLIGFMILALTSKALYKYLLSRVFRIK